MKYLGVVTEANASQQWLLLLLTTQTFHNFDSNSRRISKIEIYHVTKHDILF